MSKRFWHHSFSFVLPALLTAVPLVSAESSHVPAPIFIDVGALGTQLRTFQKATAGQTQDELEPGLRNLLKAFPGTTFQIYPAASAGSTEPPVHSGISWIFKDRNWYASEVYPQSPGDRAGVQVGDRFLGTYSPETGQTPTDVCKVPQPVHLKLERAGKTMRTSFSCKVFNRVALVSRMINAHIGYLRPDPMALTSSGSLLKTFFTATVPLEQQGMTSLVLDLRGNTGGLLNVSPSLADLFIRQGVLLRLLEQGGERLEPGRYPQRATDGREDSDVPLVVLVNRDTANGAELLAADLQENGRARIVGEQTAGVASIYQVYPLTLGKDRLAAQVLVPDGVWLTPTGRNISGTGITPDVVVKQDPLTVAFFPDPKTDPQLAAAVKVLLNPAP